MKHFIVALYCLVTVFAFTSCEKEDSKELTVDPVTDYRIEIVSQTNGVLESNTPDKIYTQVYAGKTVLHFKKIDNSIVKFTFRLTNPCPMNSVIMTLYSPTVTRYAVNDKGYNDMELTIEGYFK